MRIFYSGTNRYGQVQQLAFTLGTHTVADAVKSIKLIIIVICKMFQLKMT